ncbi:DUF4880 domain-containing protein [Bradyrhizobium sp. LHD-71]|uniref:FecR family protein n=1 Tax=Bradyrhizobium sp. LHD-71 TaxID=3072141 RepID=UPI00280EA017|nr:DUF4880 domain-containing protein [Bradyrhizobium sp. LHD-71]MDQ8728094.1 DUF4880 domain-containing protein [Bradyrhizobium sp. LHD-71]
MTVPPDDHEDLDPLMREALAWVVRLRSGEATKSDLEAIRRWRSQSPDHEQAFRLAAGLWRDLKLSADALGVHRRAQLSPMRGYRPVPWSLSRRAFMGGAVASVAAAYLAYDPPMDLWPSLSELAADYRTGKGERRELALANGVDVTLGTLTSLSVLSDRDDTRIELISGEAVFSAKSAAGRSVVVQALGVRTVATRASFNARCLDGRVSVTCIDGQLDIEHERNLVQLNPEQQVEFSAAAGLGTAVATDVNAATAWQKGLLVVRDRPLAEVVEEVNRYRPGRVIVTNVALARRLVNGTFHLDRLDNFPSQVRELFGAGVRALPGGVVLLS